MDSFTERILERARERQKKLFGGEAVTPLKESNENTINTSASSLQELKNQDNLVLRQSTSEGNLPKFVRQSSVTRISTDISSPKAQSNTLNIQKDNFNMEIKLSSTDNVRVHVEFQEGDDSSSDEKENYEIHLSEGDSSEKSDTQPTLREDSKKQLQRLAKLYAGGADDANISSPIHRTEAKFAVKNSPEKAAKLQSNDETVNKDAKNCRKGLGGLAKLAQTINQWEDEVPKTKKEVRTSKVVKKSWKPPAPKPPVSNTASVENSPVRAKSTKPPAPKPPVVVSTKLIGDTGDATSDSSTDSGKDSSRKFILDRSVVETLESQGFTRTTSNSRLVYSYDKQNSPNRVRKAEISSSRLASHKNECILEEPENEDSEVATSKLVSSISQTSYNKSGSSSPVRGNLKSAAIANKAAIFESASSPSRNNVKDPALMSVSERKALFEKNKGSALIPKAPFSMAAPITTNKSKPQILKTTVLNSPKTPEKSTSSISKTNKTQSTTPTLITNPKKDSAYKVPSGKPGGIATKLAALFQNKSTIGQQQIEDNIREQRQKEMDILLNRFDKNKDVIDQLDCQGESDSDLDEDAIETTPMITTEKTKAEVVPATEVGKKRRNRKLSKEDSPKVKAVLEDVKRIKVSSKPGRLYPCLSDIEATTEPETDANTPTPNSSMEDNCSDSDAAETSFGREILETVCKKQTPQKRTFYEETIDSSDQSDILDGADDYLDEVMAYNEANLSRPTPPKQSRSLSPPIDVQASNSFQYKKFTPSKSSSKDCTPKMKTPTIKVSPRKSDEHKAYVVDGDNVLPLTHTVSFYRKQQTQQKTPVRQVIRYPIIEEKSESSKPSSDQKLEVQKRISKLEKEIDIQNQTIKQTSQGLNWCYSTPEFTRSTEQVELERVLLLATHRRSAAHHEIERLNVLGTDSNYIDESILQKGNLTISNIVLPLKQEYVRALNATGGKGHHFVCLVKCAEQVHATTLVSTIASNDRNPNLELNIPGKIVLNNVASNFTIQVEVYCLIAEEEILPHEVKYHIKKKATPKKAKTDSRLARPPMESLADSQEVRLSTFASMGYVVFDVQAINKKNWTLNNAPSKSPLKGNTEMRVKFELKVNVEHRGFLNILEYVSDSNMWLRRWCVLKGHTLSYWKYPDDEKLKSPIDFIDLKHCTSQQIGPAPRQISARLFTMMIELMRPAQPNDRSSALVMRDGDSTVVRHVLSADTKEERVEWMSMLNKTITAIKINETSK